MREVRRFLFRAVSVALLATIFLAVGAAGAQGIPTGTPHSVSLAWQAPSPVGGSGTISGYNVYRSAAISAAAYTKLNVGLIAGLSYTDSSVLAGASYNYCVTAVDSLNEESVCSAPAMANVPSNPNAPSAPLITVK